MNSLSLRRWAALIFLTTLPGWLVAEQGPPQQDDNLATATAELKELPREIVLDGVVEAIQQSTVSAQTGGQVVEILFDVDDFVQKGDLIVRLKSTEQKAGLTQAEAELKSAQAKMREAQNEYTRIKDIFAKKLVSQSDMDKANAALKTAKAAAEAAAATINQAREQLSYTEVRAPYSGIVTSRQVEIGEIAQPGQPLMTGISLDKLRVIVDVPQRLIPGIRKHMQASIILPDGETVEARKITIFPFADQATNTFKVRLELPENLAGMFPGMFIKAAFQTGAKKELLIPAQAVVYRSEVTGVYVLDESNKIHLRHVRLGHPVEDGMISVLSGINPGDKVALDPIAAGVTLKKAAKAEAAMADMGISGRIAKHFLTTEITPLMALVGLLMGVFAVMVTPREEEPQINVTFANVFIPFPGATVSEVEHLVAAPAEQVLSEIEGIKHIYSSARPGLAVLTVQFKVGEDRTQAIVRLFSKVYSNQDWLPANLGVGQPLVKPKGIDDVPIVSITLWTEEQDKGAYELGQVAHAIESELKRVPGTRDIYTLGAPEQVIHVLLDPQALAGYGIDIADLRRTLTGENVTRDNLQFTAFNREILVQAGVFLSSADEIGELVVGVHDDKPVYLRDVASIERGSDHPTQYTWLGTGPEAERQGITVDGKFPAVTIAVAKKPGTNAVQIAERVIQRLEQIKGIVIPEGVNSTVTRNYGETADAKAKKLIQKLIFATLSVVLLVLISIGWREAFIVGTAVVVTLAITLFASWAWGFTLNRVSLFALIFSIGILVDDAIVVVENIHRHLQMGAQHLLEAIPKAVDEVGGPTILATFTVIAALLPMAFVSGLMGPYMSPIPINASLGMLISLSVAFILTPWMTNRVLANVAHHHFRPADAETSESFLDRLFRRAYTPFLRGNQGNFSRWMLLLGILILMALSVSLVASKLVVMKMLPFDNKSEFQVVLDMPEGTSLEQTSQVLDDIGDYLGTVAEVTDYQVYSGTTAPISFNGLVRQYYLREGANLGDIQVNLVDKHYRERKSHEVALAVRKPIEAIARRWGGNAKIVEVPPGPPVLSPLVAEIYGLDYQGQIAMAKNVRKVFESTADIVDVDDSVEFPSDKRIVAVDQSKAARMGLSQGQVGQDLATVLGGEDVSFVHGLNQKYAVPIRLEYSEADKADLDQVLSLRVRSQNGKLVPMSEVVELINAQREFTAHHKDLLPVVYVTGDMAGETDSPLYGMFDIFSTLKDQGEPEQYFISQPDNPYEYSLKWDGEWQVTYDTFRDMGIAYGVGLILIYLLVVAQFRSYLVPLVIMAPIPLTIIGILPGHALLGAQFTATSMIGMIALAGIIVRNSILLVDFINQQVREGIDFQTAVIRSGAVRAKPIILTGLAAMAGAFFILDDPIFSGLAVSLIFGIFVSTMLTLVVIPVVYYATMRKRQHLILAADD